jgi:hypothetical protein
MRLQSFGHLRRLRRRWVVCVLVALGLWLAARVDRAVSQRAVQGVHPDVIRWGDVPIRSILRREKDVLVVNRFGMFRSLLSDPRHRWQPVAMPLTIPLSGRFADHPPGCGEICYWVGDSWNSDPGSLERGKGVYVSRDDGGTWQQVCDRGDFAGVVVCAGGRLYARVERATPIDPATRTGGGFQSQVLASKDGGRTWSDISPLELNDLVILKRDAVNPSLVFIDQVGGADRRGRTLIAADDRFLWTQANYAETAARDREPLFLPCGTFDQRPGGDLDATLRNFFDLPFGQQTHVSVICLQPNASHYRFALDEAKPVPFEIGMRRSSSSSSSSSALGPLMVFDDPGSTVNHMVFATRPSGQWGFAFHNRMHWNGGAGDEERYVSRSEERATTHAVTATQPYRRDVDLNDFIPFREVGDYRIQIAFRPLSSGAPGCWTEVIASDVFTVTITPARGRGAADFGWPRSP